MKVFLLILTILFFFSTLGLGVIYLMQSKELEQSKTAYDSLRMTFETALTEKGNLQNKYNDLEKIAYPRVFPSRSTLEEWAKDHTSYDSRSSYSQDAVKLMETAKLDGYWMGIAAGEKLTVNGKITLQVPVYPYYDGINLYVYNVAVVGESDLYAIDPATGTILKMAEMMAKMR